MTQKLLRRARLSIVVSVAALTGCSSFVQQAAPVEAPTQPAGVYQAPARTVPAGRTAGAAQTEPYRADAPVVTGTAATPTHAPVVTPDDGKTHVVAPGENLFRISLSHGLKYQQVASWNNLPDYNIKVGQVLRLTPPPGQNAAPVVAAASGATAATQDNVSSASGDTKAYPRALKLAYSDNAARSIAAQSEGPGRTAGKPVSARSEASAPAPRAAASAPQAKTESSAPRASGEDAIAWIWPANGKLLRGYSDNNKGVDIGGRIGQPVLAAADGKVVYSGSGLRGYGKLIIIKHNKTFLSAYAHNNQLLVKEGQLVKKGQKIAEMGSSDADQVKLHFEIRRFGKPVDPMQYLNSKP